MTTGSLHYGTDRPVNASERNAYMRNKSHIVGVLPAPIQAPRLGCVRCIHLEDCQVEGPGCEGTILVKMNSGEVVRM